MTELVGLKSGGVVAMGSTSISTRAQHNLGTVAIDAQGGEYVYTRGSSAGDSATKGKWVHINSSFNIALLAVNDAKPGPIGVLCSSNASTANFGWVQRAGVNTETALSSGTQAGVILYNDSATAGLVGSTASTAQPRILGVEVLSTGTIASTAGFGTVLLSYPQLLPVAT